MAANKERMAGSQFDGDAITAYQTATLTMTLGEHEGHFSYCKPF